VKREIQHWLLERERPGGGHCVPLLAEFHPHVCRVSRRYSDAYFPERAKNARGRAVVAEDVFLLCDRSQLSRWPYQGRVPFVTYLEEDFGEGRILEFTFYNKISHTRWVLRRNYRCNVRNYPDLRRKAELYRELEAVLAQVAVRKGARWTLAGAPRQQALPGHALEQALAQARFDDLPQAVRFILARSEPLSCFRILDLLQAARPRCIPGRSPLPLSESTQAGPQPDQDLLLELKRIVLGLAPAERKLLQGLALGLSYEELGRRHPEHFPSKPTTSRIARRVSDAFLEPFAKRTSDTGLSPNKLLNMVLDLFPSHPGDEP